MVANLRQPAMRESTLGDVANEHHAEDAGPVRARKPASQKAFKPMWRLWRMFRRMRPAIRRLIGAFLAALMLGSAIIPTYGALTNDPADSGFMSPADFAFLANKDSYPLSSFEGDVPERRQLLLPQVEVTRTPLRLDSFVSEFGVDRTAVTISSGALRWDPAVPRRDGDTLVVTVNPDGTTETSAARTGWTLEELGGIDPDEGRAVAFASLLLGATAAGGSLPDGMVWAVSQAFPAGEQDIEGVAMYVGLAVEFAAAVTVELSDGESLLVPVPDLTATVLLTPELSVTGMVLPDRVPSLGGMLPWYVDRRAVEVATVRGMPGVLLDFEPEVVTIEGRVTGSAVVYGYQVTPPDTSQADPFWVSAVAGDGEFGTIINAVE
jgi:hypothetical protein